MDDDDDNKFMTVGELIFLLEQCNPLATVWLHVDSGPATSDRVYEVTNRFEGDRCVWIKAD